MLVRNHLHDGPIIKSNSRRDVHLALSGERFCSGSVPLKWISLQARRLSSLDIMLPASANNYSSLQVHHQANSRKNVPLSINSTFTASFSQSPVPNFIITTHYIYLVCCGLIASMLLIRFTLLAAVLETGAFALAVSTAFSAPTPTLAPRETATGTTTSAIEFMTTNYINNHARQEWLRITWDLSRTVRLLSKFHSCVGIFSYLWDVDDCSHRSSCALQDGSFFITRIEHRIKLTPREEILLGYNHG